MNSLRETSFRGILEDEETMNDILRYVESYLHTKFVSDYFMQDSILIALKEAVKREKKV